ncbi:MULTISPECIES: hypothetical protein [unclassified Streptomyces]|uniref:hypothetical protein n=1 Tax=unclassified Streptomyces TaxID=2593676 RepID=UPI003D8A8048
MQDVREERADAALTPALVSTRAELVLVPEEQLRLHKGGHTVALRRPFVPHMNSLPRNSGASPGPDGSRAGMGLLMTVNRALHSTVTRA